MDTTSATTATTGTVVPASPGKGVISSDFNTFLTMLTVQLENQDPLNPMDSSEYAVQLATFSSVEQQAMTNDLLTEMLARDTSSDLSELARWIGNSVRVQVDPVFEGSPILISPTPQPGAAQSELIVRDDAGTIRNRLNISSGGELVEWSGVDESGSPLSWGQYSLEVVSYDSAGSEMSSHAPEVYAEVQEARSSESGIQLVLKGGMKVDSLAVSAVRSGGE
ncbi:flagellar basal-body rod modification protein FlgD [Aliiruegeria haliotis]|uniref:Basal-body rod modification protein FlgD n=1 Tax=Aliiruegeria haliotis TaxID=1280846 RepID=A0A2T0REC1_9RHOB|nr:flagellar hook capping FlgD N-terminal domain-containing protein [Aliiruegeria haliotis]PRY19460.1 flagellar basal-body rod modification protein FlgD [Aliiruegeria haliotis]